MAELFIKQFLESFMAAMNNIFFWKRTKLYAVVITPN